MAIKNHYGSDGSELWKYFSNQARNPDDTTTLRKVYDAFKDNHDKPLTIRSLYYYEKKTTKMNLLI